MPWTKREKSSTGIYHIILRGIHGDGIHADRCQVENISIRQLERLTGVSCGLIRKV